MVSYPTYIFRYENMIFYTTCTFLTQLQYILYVIYTMFLQKCNIIHNAYDFYTNIWYYSWLVQFLYIIYMSMNMNTTWFICTIFLWTNYIPYVLHKYWYTSLCKCFVHSKYCMYVYRVHLLYFYFCVIINSFRSRPNLVAFRKFGVYPKRTLFSWQWVILLS